VLGRKEKSIRLHAQKSIIINQRIKGTNISKRKRKLKKTGWSLKNNKKKEIK
jgi:hypothetical protein